MSTYLTETVAHGVETLEILIEVDEPSGEAPWEPYSYETLRGGEPAFAKRAFEKGMQLIRTCAEQVAQTVRKVNDTARPDEVEVKFGVKMSGEAGALIAKSGTEAQMEVTFKWEEGMIGPDPPRLIASGWRRFQRLLVTAVITLVAVGGVGAEEVGPRAAQPGPAAAAAYELLEKEQMQAACDAFVRLLDERTMDPWAFRGAVLCAVGTEDFRQPVLDALAGWPPDSVLVLFARGSLHYHDGDHESAEELLREAVDREPDFVLALNALGATIQRRGRGADAIPFLERALCLAPDLDMAQRNLGRARLCAGVWDRLVALLTAIPQRWHSFRDPLVPISGKSHIEVLTTSSKEENDLAWRFITTLAFVPIEQRSAVINGWLETHQPTEIDLWLPALPAERNRTTKHEEAVLLLEAWLQLAEALGRRDVAFLAAAMAIDHAVAENRIETVEAISESWAELPVEPVTARSAARVAYAHATIAFRLGNTENALTAYRRARSRFQAVDDQNGQGRSWMKEGDVLFRWGNNEAPLAAYRKARDFFEAADNQRGQGDTWVREGEVLLVLGDTEGALAAYHKARDFCAAADYPLCEGNSWRGEADLLLRLGKYEESLAAYIKGRELFTAAGSPVGQGNTWRGEADVLFHRGDNQKALTVYRKARELFVAAGDQLGQGNAWLREGEVHFRLGDNQAALAAYRTARKLYVAVEEVINQGVTWRSEGDVLFRLGNNEEALMAYRKARQLFAHAGERLGQGNSWIGEGDVLFRSGDNEEALAAYRTARELFVAVGHQLGQATAWKDKAKVLSFLERNDEALNSYRKARVLFQLVEDKLGQAQTWSGEAEILFHRGKNEKGLDAYRKAREFYQEMGDQLGEGNAWKGEADILFRVGLNEGAREAYRTAREHFVAVEDRLGQGNAWNGEADVLSSWGRSQEAIDAYRKARKHFEAMGGKIGQGYTWSGEAFLLLRSGDNKGSLGAYRHAQELFAAMADKLSQGNALFGEARVLRRMGKNEAAVHVAVTAGIIFEESEAIPNRRNALLLEAQCRNRSTEADRIVSVAREAIGVHEEWRKSAILDLTRTEMDLDISGAYDLLVSIRSQQPGGIADALTYAEEARSRALLDMMATTPAALADRSSPNRADEWSRLKRESAALEKAIRMPADRDDLAEKKLRRQDLCNELQKNEYEQLVADEHRLEVAPPLKVAGIRQLADAVGPILLYYSAEKELIGFVILPNEANIYMKRIFWPRLLLRSAVDTFTSQLANPLFRDRPGPTARTHWDQVIEVFLKHLPASGPLTIIPHGPLHQLPFEALADTQGRRLYERWDVSVAPSASALKAARERHQLRGDADLFVAFSAGEGLTRAGREAFEIAEIFGRDKVVFQPTAAEFDNYRGVAARARHLLITTRGVLETGVCSRWDTYLEIDSTPGVHDKRLTAAEIAGVPLRGELVTLAACDTAAGKALLSDERLDLSRAFLIAGAASVLATRWRIPDNAAVSRFLADFYHAYRGGGPDGRGLSKAQALTVARRRSHQRGEPPQVWAAWVLIGDPR